ncbi:ATP-binding protein [Omnitrophica bacterium]|nr:ATP-binding protein [Candidatus Omnitrophota bacterium]
MCNFKNKKSMVNLSFGIFGISIFIWQFFEGIFLSLTTYNPALNLCKLSYIGVILLPICYLHFVLEFLKHDKRKIISILFYLFGLWCIYTMFATDLFISGARKYFFGYYPTAGPYHKVYLLSVPFSALTGFALLFQEFSKQSDINKRNSIKYLLLAYIAFPMASVDYLPNYNVEIYPFGFIFVTAFLAFNAYAIVRHQLMEIEVIIKKTLVFTGLFAGAYAIFAGFAFLGQVVFEQITGGNRWVSLIPSIAVIILILRPLDNFLTAVTDKFLFQKKYDYRELLKTFTTEVLTVLDIDKLVHLTVDKLSGIMKIQTCGMLLLNKDKSQYDLAASVGISGRQNVFYLDNTLVSFLGRTRLYLSIKHQGEDSKLPSKILEDMNKLKLELAIPLVIHNEMIGILTLGKKKSDEDYTQDDMAILLPLARTLSIAINNAEMFDELGKTQAEAAQREKMAVIGTLAAGINHEICNPLGIARGQCEVYLLNAQEGLYKERSKDEQIYEAMKIMEKVIMETDRATAITKKLSTFAKPGTGDINEDVNISHEVDEVMALIGHELRLENVNFVKDIPKNLSHIQADHKQIEEIFFNLIRNAGQAIEKAGKITVKAVERDNRVVVDIEDTGHGIPENKLEQIFNPFYTTKAPGKGTGLGLFIVRQIVQRNKGTISVRSKVGEGTTFTLEFPVPQLVGK